MSRSAIKFGTVVAFSLALAGLSMCLGCAFVDEQVVAPIHRFKNPDWKTLGQRVAQYGGTVRPRLEPAFVRAGVSYPPNRVELLAIKQDRVLEVYGADAGKPLRYIRSYPVLAASGHFGPKLREGDRQVPEGIYPIEEINPNSTYHLSLRVGYPNDFDWDHAVAEGRKEPGQDIMIHGNHISAGCLAMGDKAAEDLFILAADAGMPNVKVVIAPVDFRRGATVPKAAKLPPWTPALYAQIRSAMRELPEPKG